MPIYVDGLQIVQPQAVSKIIENPILGLQSEEPLVVALIANANGGVPQTWTEVYNYGDAVNAFYSGNAVDLAQRVFSPSGVNRGARKMLIYRANLGTQAKAPLITATQLVMTTVTPSTATTAGTLIAGTYLYKVTAINANGESLPAAEVSQVAAGGNTSINTLTWSAVAGSTGFKIYRTAAGGAANSETFLAQVGVVTSYADTGAVTPAVSSPTTVPPAIATTHAAIVLTTQQYGTIANQVRVQILFDSPTESYTAKVSGFLGGNTATRTNIQRPMFTITYAGTQIAVSLGTANITVTAASVTLAVTTDGATAVPTESATFLYTDYPTLGAMVDAINGLGAGAWSAVAKSPRNMASNILDNYGASAIKATGGTNNAIVKTIKANNQALTDWFNTQEPYCQAVRLNGTRILTMTAYIGMVGGSNGAAPVLADYTNALTALQALDCQIVLCDSTDGTTGSATVSANIHAALDAHCALMSQTGGNGERIAIVGGSAGESITDATTRAANLSSYRTAVCYPGIIDNDQITKLATVYSPVWTAAIVAGILAGQPVGRPATRKTVACVGPEVVIGTPNIDTLLLGGVLPIVPHVLEGARIVQSILTYNATQDVDGNLLHREISSRLAADKLVRLLREQLGNAMIGKVLGSLAKATALAVAQATLRRAQKEQLIVGRAGQPAWRGLTATIAGDVVTVSVAVSVVAPGNYVVINANLVSFAG